MSNRGISRKVSALLFAVLFIVSMLPAGAFADNTDDSNGTGGAHVHAMEYVERVDANCVKSGVDSYYYCAGCKKKFFDHLGDKEVANEENLIIPIKDHAWDEGKADPEDSSMLIFTCSSCGTTRRGPKPVDPVDPADPDVPVDPTGPDIPVDPEPEESVVRFPEAKKVKLSGSTLKFKTRVVTQPEEITKMNAGKVDHIWLKAGKAKMTISWKTSKAMKFIDGVVLLRKTGKAKAYKEVAVISFKKYGSSGSAEWAPKKKYVDKTAADKDTPYSYVLVSYLDKDGQRFVSECSDWAAGQTTASTLKTVNTASISSTSVKLQYKGSARLKLTYDKPDGTYNAKSFRWYTDDKKTAKVNASGKVTASGVGTTTVRGRLSSGDDVTCKVKVVGAFKPGKPKLKVDTTTESTITVSWTKAKNATSYDVYRSDDGIKWKDPVNTKATSYKFKKLVKNHRYTFYVVARNDNHGYSAVGANSNVVNQKAVKKVTTNRVYQNPKDYIQIANSISTHGYDHYIAPVLISDESTRDGCIDALLKTANKYLGDPYASGKTGAPGSSTGIDAGGLVIEACYGAGIDLWPVSPSTRETNAAPAIMKAKLKNVNSYGKPTESDFPDVYRGDLIFFSNSKGKVVHIAIYQGYGNIIHTSKIAGKVETTKLTYLLDKKGAYNYTVAAVRRVFA